MFNYVKTLKTPIFNPLFLMDIYNRRNCAALHILQKLDKKCHNSKSNTQKITIRRSVFPRIKRKINCTFTISSI